MTSSELHGRYSKLAPSEYFFIQQKDAFNNAPETTLGAVHDLRATCRTSLRHQL